MAETQNPSPTPFSRRRFLTITAAAGAALLGGRLLAREGRAGLTILRESRTLMGTVINLALVTSDKTHGQAAITATFAEMARLINYFDHRQASGLVGQLNRMGRLPDAPPDLLDLVDRAVDSGRLTDGALDISIKPLWDACQAGNLNVSTAHSLVDYRRIEISGNEISFNRAGMAITLDGIAKGRVVDAAISILRAKGFQNVMVEAGGDLVGHGRRADGKPWRVGIAAPRSNHGHKLLSVLPVSGRAVASSGDYMNRFSSDFSQHHIIDPRTGRSPTDLAAVTVIALTATEADALSTAVMVLGSDAGRALVEDQPHVEALLVTKKMQLIRSTGFPAG